MYLCSPLAILDKAAIGSPWLPVQRITVSEGRKDLILSGVTILASGIWIYPKLLAELIFDSIERPKITIFLLNFTAASTICWILERLLEKVDIINLPVALWKTS